MNLQTQTRTPRSVRDPGGAAGAAPPRAGRRAGRLQSQHGRPGRFLAPVAIYLLVFYAYPLYRNLDLSLRDYTVRSFVQGDAPFIGLGNYRTVFADPTFAPALLHTVVFTARVAGLPVRHRPGAGGVLQPALPAVGHAAGAVPRAVAAAADRVGVHLVVDAQQRLRHRQRRPRRRSASARSTGSPRRDWSLVSVIIANIWIGIPFNLVVLYSGLQGIPPQIYEAAAARRRDRLAAVLADHLPAAAPGLGDHPAARPGLHAEGLRHHLDHDARAARSTRRRPSPPGPTGSASATRCPRSGPGAAVGNLLIIMALRLRPHLHPGPAKAAAVMTTTREPGGRPASGLVLTARHAVPGLLDDQRVLHPPTSDMRKSPPDLFPVARHPGRLPGGPRPAAALPRHQPARRPGHASR